MCVCTCVHKGAALGASPSCVVLLSVRADARTAVQYYSGFFVTQKSGFPLCSSVLRPHKGVYMRGTPCAAVRSVVRLPCCRVDAPPPVPPQGGAPPTTPAAGQCGQPYAGSPCALRRHRQLRVAHTARRPPVLNALCVGQCACAGWLCARSLTTPAPPALCADIAGFVRSARPPSQRLRMHPIRF